MKPLWILLLLSIYFNSLLCDDAVVLPANPNKNATVKIANSSTTTSDKTSSINTVNNSNNTVPIVVVEQQQQQKQQPPENVAKPSQIAYDGNGVPGGFYIFTSLGFVVIVVIIYKVYRGRFSRAERRYGVQGQQGTQELIPLPLAIDEDDSENDDQTLFDIHQQLHARDNFVL